jgi:hypothetical protein
LRKAVAMCARGLLLAPASARALRALADTLETHSQPADELADVPDELLCPIAATLMLDPVRC